MFEFMKDKKKKDMQAIKEELNKPLDGPIGPANTPIFDKVIDNGGEERYRIPNDLEPAIPPPYEPAPAPRRAPSTPMPVEPINRIDTSLPEIASSETEEMPGFSKSLSGSDDEAPLFIKIDKYSDLLAHVKEMKRFLGMFKQTLDVMRDIETARDDALKILRASATRLERVLETADAELLKPDISEQVEAAGKEEAAHVQDTLESLKSEINSLKSELKGLE